MVEAVLIIMTLAPFALGVRPIRRSKADDKREGRQSYMAPGRQLLWGFLSAGQNGVRARLPHRDLYTVSAYKRQPPCFPP